MNKCGHSPKNRREKTDEAGEGRGGRGVEMKTPGAKFVTGPAQQPFFLNFLSPLYPPSIKLNSHSHYLYNSRCVISISCFLLLALPSVTRISSGSATLRSCCLRFNPCSSSLPLWSALSSGEIYTLSFLVLSCLILSCLVLSCLVFPCLFLGGRVRSRVVCQ